MTQDDIEIPIRPRVRDPRSFWTHFFERKAMMGNGGLLFMWSLALLYAMRPMFVVHRVSFFVACGIMFYVGYRDWETDRKSVV